MIKTGTCYVVQAGLELPLKFKLTILKLIIFLVYHSELWITMHDPPSPTWMLSLSNSAWSIFKAMTQDDVIKGVICIQKIFSVKIPLLNGNLTCI